jgi:SAM-dependent methyltransferase
MLRRLLQSAAVLLASLAAVLVGWFLLRKARPWGPFSPGTEANIRAFDLPDAHMYDRSASRLLGPAYRALARDLATRVEQGPILDVGAGPGHLAAELAMLLPRMEVRGVDLMPEMVELAQRRAQEAGLDHRLSFVEGDVAELPFPDSSIGVVTSSFSMHHWEDVRSALREVERVLVPGGRAVLYDLPPWFLRLAAHAADSQDPGAAEIFAQVQDGHVGWPLGVPFVRRLELIKAGGAV